MHSYRNATLDVARGFTVFIMPAVHSVMLYSALPVRQEILGQILRFLAEGPGAQLFLMLMGISVNLSGSKPPQQILNRAISLFGLAYLLNYLRLVLPLLFHIIPEEFLKDIAVSANDTGKLNAFLMGDILQTAAISYLVCALLFYLHYFRRWTLTLLIIIILCTPLLYRTNNNSSLWTLQYLFTGKPPISFFPVFPWIVYPLVGLVIGKYFTTNNSSTFYRWAFVVGFLLFGVGKIVIAWEPEAWNNNFYCPGPGAILYHLGIVFMWLVLCQYMVRLFRENYFFHFLKWLSKHITLIYFIQWMVVLWLMPFYSYHRLDLWSSVVALTLNSIISFGLTNLLIGVKKKFLKSNREMEPRAIAGFKSNILTVGK